jgi:hypothetical protein
VRAGTPLLSTGRVCRAEEQWLGVVVSIWAGEQALVFVVLVLSQTPVRPGRLTVQRSIAPTLLSEVMNFLGLPGVGSSNSRSRPIPWTSNCLSDNCHKGGSGWLV